MKKSKHIFDLIPKIWQLLGHFIGFFQQAKNLLFLKSDVFMTEYSFSAKRTKENLISFSMKKTISPQNGIACG